MAKQELQSLFTAEEYKANFKVNKKGKKEEKVQLQVCDYLRNTYPDLIWFCDLASGLKLPIWIAAKNKQMRSSRGLPDLFIAKPVSFNNESGTALLLPFSGLFIELKKDGIRLKNGNLPTNEHHAEQEAILVKLRALGYRAEFACGYEEAVKLINEYLK